MKSNVQKILLFVIILSCMHAPATFCDDKDDYFKLYIASGWTSSRIIDDYNSLLCNDNNYICNYIFVNNLCFINSIDSTLQNTRKREIFIDEYHLGKNYRLLAIINHNSITDTIVIPYSCQYTMLNSKYYDFDKSLFEKLISKVPYYMYYDIKNDIIWEQK